MLTLNFKNDLDCHINFYFQSLGFSDHSALTGTTTEARTNYLLNLLRRLPEKRPRDVYFLENLPTNGPYKDGFKTLFRSIEKGESIRPYLSRKTKNLDYNDLMLNDWGIHHFHLGNTVEKDGFISRTKDVAFAVIKKNSVFFLGVFNHDAKDDAGKYAWVNTGLIEIAHKNWPHLIDTYKIRATGQELSLQDRKNIRKKHCNVSITTSDGTVYYSPGGGIMSDGGAMLNYMYCMQLLRDIEYKEELVKSNEDTIRDRLKIKNNTPIEIRANFKICPYDGFTIAIYEATSKTEIRFN